LLERPARKFPSVFVEQIRRADLYLLWVRRASKFHFEMLPVINVHSLDGFDACLRYGLEINDRISEGKTTILEIDDHPTIPFHQIGLVGRGPIVYQL
jgi:hypothetical protein